MTTSSVIKPLIIGSYNVYFDEFFFMERFRFIIENLLSECHVVCLQEIPEQHLAECERVLMENQFLYIAYASHTNYGLITASKLPAIFKDTKFKNTNMGRCFLDFIIQFNDKSIHLINTHLESLFQFQAIRESQMKQIIDYCLNSSPQSSSQISSQSSSHSSSQDLSQSSSHSSSQSASQISFLESTIIIGDLNSVYKKLYFDRFLTPQVDQVTWFGKRFNMASSSCRFDRIYTGSQIKLLGQVKSTGDQIIPTIGCYPSDHDGLIFKIV